MSEAKPASSGMRVVEPVALTELTVLERTAERLAKLLQTHREANAMEEHSLIETLAKAHPVKVAVLGSPAEGQTMKKALMQGLERAADDIEVHVIQLTNVKSSDTLANLESASQHLVVIAWGHYLAELGSQTGEVVNHALAELLTEAHQALADGGGLLIDSETVKHFNIIQAYGFQPAMQVFESSSPAPHDQPMQPKLALWAKTDPVLTAENKQLIRAFDFRINNRITVVLSEVRAFDQEDANSNEQERIISTLKDIRERFFKRHRLINQVLPQLQEHPQAAMRDFAGPVAACQVEFRGIIQDVSDCIVAMEIEPEQNTQERQRLLANIQSRYERMLPMIAQISAFPTYQAYRDTLPEGDRSQFIKTDEQSTL